VDIGDTLNAIGDRGKQTEERGVWIPREEARVEKYLVEAVKARLDDAATKT
jgi:hypothetical protein